MSKNSIMGINIRVYFIQTQPSPIEGPHAQEVDRDTFLNSALSNPYVAIDYDEVYHGLYLRFDQPLDEVV